MHTGLNPVAEKQFYWLHVWPHVLFWRLSKLWKVFCLVRFCFCCSIRLLASPSLLGVSKRCKLYYWLIRVIHFTISFLLVLIWYANYLFPTVLFCVTGRGFASFLSIQTRTAKTSQSIQVEIHKHGHREQDLVANSPYWNLPPPQQAAAAPSNSPVKAAAAILTCLSAARTKHRALVS